jgi:two-component system CAI-1 autoinducer sensor kinase/phosphatase CqsS
VSPELRQRSDVPDDRSVSGTLPVLFCRLTAYTPPHPRGFARVLKKLFVLRQVLLSLRARLREELLEAPLEPVHHLSTLRLRVVSITMAFGYILFYYVWTAVAPQPYENLALRLTGSTLGLTLSLPYFASEPTSKRTAVWFNVVCAFNLPISFFWMYVANQGNSVWLASVGAMILIYFHLTDWRIATVVLFASAAVTFAVSAVIDPTDLAALRPAVLEHGIVFLFCWAMAAVLGLSSANLRRERLQQMLSTIGILAHELRTPLATISLIGQALEGRFERLSQAGSLPKNDYVDLRRQTTKMSELVKLMNQQINTQIANAGLLHPSLSKEEVRMSEVVDKVLQQYPFATAEERDCITVQIRSDFLFTGSFNLASQMLVNLLKNALRALAAKPEKMQTHDIVIQVQRQESARGPRGLLIVEDRGIGMPPAVLRRIFDPFFTTNTRSGHGLGLTFCLRAAAVMRGTIHCHSVEGQGTRFTVELPALLETERIP